MQPSLSETPIVTAVTAINKTRARMTVDELLSLLIPSIAYRETGNCSPKIT
jgi:hypothetical protein